MLEMLFVDVLPSSLKLSGSRDTRDVTFGCTRHPWVWERTWKWICLAIGKDVRGIDENYNKTWSIPSKTVLVHFAFLASICLYHHSCTQWFKCNVLPHLCCFTLKGKSISCAGILWDFIVAAHTSDSGHSWTSISFILWLLHNSFMTRALHLTIWEFHDRFLAFLPLIHESWGRIPFASFVHLILDPLLFECLSHCVSRGFEVMKEHSIERQNESHACHSLFHSLLHWKACLETHLELRWQKKLFSHFLLSLPYDLSDQKHPSLLDQQRKDFFWLQNHQRGMTLTVIGKRFSSRLQFKEE